MRHRAFNGIHQQQYAIHHTQNALYFTTEVGVTRGVNDVDVHTFILDGGVFGQNGNATLFFKIVGVHYTFVNLLVFTESTGLTQQLVNQRGLAVVNVGDNGDVTNLSGHGNT
ncbi:hypothetical protein D3C85_1336690 [compost metagenome]